MNNNKLKHTEKEELKYVTVTILVIVVSSAPLKFVNALDKGFKLYSQDIMASRDRHRDICYR